MRHKNDGLHSKVLNFKPFEDYQGRYISYCDFNVHRGLVLRPAVCERRQCDHYHKFYIEGGNQNVR